MSSIGSVGNGLNLSEILQQALRERQTIGKDTTGQDASTGSVQSQFENQFTKALTLLGISNNEATSITNDIHTAIDNLRQNSNGSKLGHGAIKAVIGQVLKDHNLNPTDVGAALAQTIGAKGTPTYGSSGSLNNNGLAGLLSSVSDSDGDGDNDAAASVLQSLQPRLDATA